MQAPPEVLAYFREKQLSPKFSWLDVWGEEHAHAFTVAGVTETKVLAEFKAAMDEAIAGGQGFEKFRENMRQRLTPLGWWGPRDVEDVEGGVGGRRRPKRVDFSKARRLETTFWSNMRAARAAGQWERAQRTKRALPYILYVRTTAAEPRPEHLKFVGLILPVDHPIWRTIWPPNGWRCKCSVRQITAAQRDRYLLEAKKNPEDGIFYTDAEPDLELQPFRNRRTGQVSMVPAGVDPGWHTNPGIGRGRTLGRILADAVDETELELARGRIARLTDSDGFRSFLWRAQRVGAERRRLQQAGASIAEVDQSAPWSQAPMPVARLPEALARDLGVERPTVTATDSALGHAPDHHYPDWIWGRVQEMTERGEVYRRPDGRIVMIEEVEARTMVLVLAPGPGGRLHVVTMFSNRDGRKGHYLRRQIEGADRVR